jgi:ubiquinone/menaquinone biosynthesis C-methylase UbiE
MTGLRFDQEATKRLLAVYMTPDVVAQRAQFLRALQPRSGERVLDVGSGPGFLAAAIAESTGPSGAVCGVDISQPLLAAAGAHCAGQPWIEFREADATKLPFADATFDAVISTQVLEYVRDVDAALAEIRRVVRSDGRVVIVDTDWDSIVWYSPNRERMSRILLAWEDHAADPCLPRSMANRLVRAGFRVESQQIVPLFNPYFETNTYSNRMIDVIAAFVSGRNGISRKEADSWAQELRSSGRRGEYFFSLNRYVFVARPMRDRGVLRAR